MEQAIKKYKFRWVGMLEYQERYNRCGIRQSGYVGQESLFFHSLAVAGFIGNGLAVMIFCTEHCLGWTLQDIVPSITSLSTCSQSWLLTASMKRSSLLVYDLLKKDNRYILNYIGPTLI